MGATGDRLLSLTVRIDDTWLIWLGVVSPHARILRSGAPLDWDAVGYRTQCDYNRDRSGLQLERMVVEHGQASPSAAAASS